MSTFNYETQVVINVTGRADGSKTSRHNVSNVTTLGALGINPTSSASRPTFPSSEMAQVAVCQGLSDAQRDAKSQQILAAYQAQMNAFNAGAGGSITDRVAKGVLTYLTSYEGFTTTKQSGKYHIGQNDLTVQQVLPTNGAASFFVVSGSAVWGK